MSPQEQAIIFFLLVVGGVLLEIILSQAHYYLTKKQYKKYHYTFGRYLFLLFFPILATIYMVGNGGTTLISVFLVFAIVGTLLEWLVGFSYHMVVGQRLWKYYRYSISTYTSLLLIPFWGLAGVLFYLIVKALP